MKASTLFALTLALLLGLGAAATARYAGLFDKKQPAPEPTPPPPPQVLVANITLFENITVQGNMVSVRPLKTPQEIADYNAHPERYMPPFPSAAHLRVPARTIQANAVLTKADFKEAELPKPLTSRIDKGYRAVNVLVMKEKAAGGVIQVEEYVDVYLTAKIYTTDGNKDPIVRTAPIARNARVVMKRGMLFNAFAVDPEGKPINFTLEVNPYRAALIEYSAGVGQLALVPVPSDSTPKKGPPFADATSKEYADEDTRITRMTAGELNIGASDLHRIFNLTPIAPPPPPIRISMLEGTNRVGEAVFPNPAAGGKAAPGGGVAPGGGIQPVGAQSSGGYSFAPIDDKECKNCGKKEEPVVGR